MGLNYVNITTIGCEGWLNLFVGEHVIALVNNTYLADKIRAEIPEKNNNKIQTGACCSSPGKSKCDQCQEIGSANPNTRIHTGACGCNTAIDKNYPVCSKCKKMWFADEHR